MPQRREPHGGEAGKVDHAHVGAGRFDAQHLDFGAEAVAHRFLQRGVAAAMQHELRIAAQQPRGVDAQRKLAADIEDRLTREGKLTLRALVVGRKSRSEMIGVFLALLELIRQKKILVVQGDEHTDMEITPAPEEHRSTYMEAAPPDSATPQTENV